MKNPLARKPKPNWKKTSKEMGAQDYGRKRGKGVPGIVQRQKQEAREELIEKIQPVIHPVATVKGVAQARAAWARNATKNAAAYRAFGTCQKCLQPNKPRHRCNLSISFADKKAAREEFERLKKLYGGGR